MSKNIQGSLMNRFLSSKGMFKFTETSPSVKSVTQSRMGCRTQQKTAQTQASTVALEEIQKRLRTMNDSQDFKAIRSASQRDKGKQQQEDLKKAIQEADRKIKVLHRKNELSHRRYQKELIDKTKWTTQLNDTFSPTKFPSSIKKNESEQQLPLLRLSPETKLILRPSQQMTSLDRSKYKQFYLKLKEQRLNNSNNDNRANFTITLFKKYLSDRDTKRQGNSPPYIQV